MDLMVDDIMVHLALLILIRRFIPDRGATMASSRLGTDLEWFLLRQPAWL